MKDLFDREIQIGDTVCHIRKIGRYMHNQYGKVKGFTPSGKLAIIQGLGSSNRNEEWKGSERLIIKPKYIERKTKAKDIQIGDLVQYKDSWLKVVETGDRGQEKLRLDLSCGRTLVILSDDEISYIRE